MHDRVCPPRRMRFSFESRCRLVSLIVEGMSPQAARRRLRSEPRDRRSAQASLPGGGWAVLCDRSPVPKRQPRRLPRELEQRILAAREYAKAGQ
jgi:hypothetical protein